MDLNETREFVDSFHFCTDDKCLLNEFSGFAVAPDFRSRFVLVVASAAAATKPVTLQFAAHLITPLVSKFSI